MKVKIEKEEKPKETCLYKRFGDGVHLLRSKDYDTYGLMIICKGHDERSDRLDVSSTDNVDVHFVETENYVTHIKSENGSIHYDDFDRYYEYIKKLEPDELAVTVKK